MNEWIESVKAVSGSLHVLRFKDPYWCLTKPIAWVPNPGQNADRVDVPVGFVTDLASIPRAFWTFLPRDGVYTFPALVHDFLYWKQDRPRDVADQIFKWGMEDFSIGAVTINAIYGSVRAGGGSAWNDNKSARDKGDKRVLATLPDNPLITFDEWKKKRGVFASDL